MYFSFVPILVLAIYLTRRKGSLSNSHGNKHLGVIPVKSQPIGIRNLGHTCYINAVLQGLYAVEAYRDMVLNSSFVDQSVGCEVKRLFTALQAGQHSCADTTSLADALQIDVFVQQDSEELFLTLVNGVDESMEGKVSPKPSHAVKFFTKQSIICSKVRSWKDKIQANLDLSVNIRGHNTLKGAIRSHFQPELLQNDPVSGVNNQYHSKEYGLQDAVKTLRLVKNTAFWNPAVTKRISNYTDILPEALVVHLKRFEFDPATQRMRKLDDIIDVPLTLDLANFTIGLSNDTNNRAEQLAQGIDERELSTFTGTMYGSATDVNYELTAVVIHEGTLESGHYYCLSRVKTGSNSNNSDNNHSSSIRKNSAPPLKDRWVQCNDEQVFDMSEEEVLAHARGTRHPFNADVSSNAYMLFYTRIHDK